VHTPPRPRPEAPSAPVPAVPPAPPEIVPHPFAEAPPEATEEGAECGPAPAWFEDAPTSPAKRGPLDGLVTIKGRQSSTKERAEEDARLQLDQSVADWLRPEVPRSWAVPRSLVDAMVRDRHVQSIEHEYGTTYKTGFQVDFSPEQREAIEAVYLKELGMHRLVMLGGGLGFVLACLAAVSGYIRADEATKGYYTNRLRLAAAVGVGAAGMAIYQLLT